LSILLSSKLLKYIFCKEIVGFLLGVILLVVKLWQKVGAQKPEAYEFETGEGLKPVSSLIEVYVYANKSLTSWRNIFATRKLRETGLEEFGSKRTFKTNEQQTRRSATMASAHPVALRPAATHAFAGSSTILSRY